MQWGDNTIESKDKNEKKSISDVMTEGYGRSPNQENQMHEAFVGK